MREGLSHFNVQGHRGGGGLKPENTLPAFEAAFDAGVNSIETDVHLTRDGVPVLMHDHFVGANLFRLLDPVAARVPPPNENPLVSTLTLDQLRCYRADLNPDPVRFPSQIPDVTPLARWVADQQGLDAYAVPTLADLISFVDCYAGEPGVHAGKTEQQRQQVRKLCLDLELKRVPFFPERIGDAFSGTAPGLLEIHVLEVLRQRGFIGRTIVRSFDHRSLQVLRALEPALTTAVIIAGTAPVAPAQLASAAGAQIYAPDFQFLDNLQVRQLHDAGIRVIPWTVNDAAAWATLTDWGVDGVTTDFPDRLVEWLAARGNAT